jgi:ribokinase
MMTPGAGESTYVLESRMPRRLWVVGSANLDTVYRVSHLPAAGETVLASQVRQFLGGKGANQAWAAKQLFPETRFVACIGRDAAGVLFQEAFGDGLYEVDSPTGSASIWVEDSGQNSIVVHSTANSERSPKHIEAIGIERGDVVLAQLEIPLSAVESLSLHTDHLILNPAPALKAAQPLLCRCEYVILNESESETFTGIRPTTSDECFRALDGIGASNGILTRGASGCVAHLRGGRVEMNAPEVQVVDTTGAGDTFCGIFAAEITLGTDPKAAIRRAMIAGSLACTKLGAMDSIPTQANIDAFLSG